jgi:uncharacterized protein involved in outer membrane biogenesis
MKGCGRVKAMRKIIIAGVVIMVVVVIAIAAGGFWLNTFIHSDAFKTEVEARASQAVGGPVTVQDVDFNVFQGVKLKGLSTQIDPSHDGGQGALKLQAASVNCGYSWTDLFQGKLKLTGITLDQPQVVLTKQHVAPPPAQALPGGLDSGTTAGPGTAVGYQVTLDHAKMSEGTLSILNADGVSMIELKGINASANTSGFFSGNSITGTLKIADMQASNLHVTKFYTPFSYRQNMLDAKSFEATAFKGDIGGDYHLDGTSPSVLNLNAKGIDVAQVTAATSSSSSAHISGSLALQSKWVSAESGDLNGEGDAQLTNGKLEGVRILEEVGRVLKINELVAPLITKAETHFVVQNRQTKFIGLQVDSPLFKLTGDGIVAFDGALNANLVLILNRDAMGRLPQAAAASFVQQQDGSGSIAFQVSGTTSNPQTDLAMRLLMQNKEIKNVINKALNKFFH